MLKNIFLFSDLDDFPNEYVWSGSSYLVGKTFESLREMFTSTKEIQVNCDNCNSLSYSMLI